MLAARRVTVGAVLAVLLCASVLSVARGGVEPPRTKATVNFTLYGTNQGWGFTPGTISSPGPTLTVNESDLVAIDLYSDNGVRHNFYVDYNGNGVPNAPPEPVSPDFTSPTVPLAYQFTASLPGTFTYYCDYHAGKMFGTFVVQAAPPPNAPPTAVLSAPTGAQDWTGGSVHAIWWNMSDAEDGNPAMAVFLNYTSSAGSGPIAGPIAGTANPNTHAWTVPAIDAPDVVVNLTVVDTGGLRGWSEASVPVVDSTAPSVSSTAPADGATGVPIGANIQVTWSEAMDPVATGSPGTVGLQEIVSGSWVSGAFSWNNPLNTILTFNPSANLAPGVQYRIVVNASAQDDSDPGNAMGATVLRTFTTGATVDTQPPQIASVAATPGIQSVGGAVNVTADVTDNFGVGGVWLEVVSPSSATTNLSMTPGPGAQYYLEAAYGEVGVHTFTIWASDTSDLWDSAGGQFEMRDTEAPQVSSVAANPPTQQAGSAVNVSAVVTDNVGVAGVWLEVRGPGGTTNVSMTARGGGVYFHDASYADIGTHPFTVWARDAAGQWASGTGQFEIVALGAPSIEHTPLPLAFLGDPVNVTANVTDGIGVAEVRLNWTDPEGMAMNVTMSAAGPTYWYEIPPQIRAGNLTYFVWARNVNNLESRTPTITLPVVVPEGFLVLYGSLELGWGYGPDNLTVPGPTIRVMTGATVRLLLIGIDGAPHDFYVDYSGDVLPGEGEPKSADFRFRGVRFTFVADREGTYTYYCEYHAGTMYGTFIVGTPDDGGPSGGGSPAALLAGVLLVVVAIVALGVIVRRRRRPEPPSQ